LAAQQVMSLPMFPQMTDQQVDQVCEALRRLN
jgi:dTDP-4-amino-4,6-dideoxygalactose transaminase